MKKYLISLLFFFSHLTQAAVLDFEDILLTKKYMAMPSLSYGGFDWDSRWYAGSTSLGTYNTSASSGTQYLSNGYGVDDLTVSRSEAFNFEGAYFGHPNRGYNIASWVEIVAYDAAGSLIGSTGKINLSSLMQWVYAGFENVSYLVISRSKHWFSMDDFTYSISEKIAAVPLVATSFLFAPFLLGFMGLRSFNRR